MVTRIISDCICGVLKDEIVANLVRGPYSLAIDESTDAFGTSYLAICAKYLSLEKQPTLITQLLSILQLRRNKKAPELYRVLKEQIFSQDPRLLKNLMGLASDQGSNMVGVKAGLGQLLRADIPHLIAFNDLSHIFNLICKESLKKYPQMILKMVTKICSHFRKPSKRMSELKEIQKKQGKKQVLEILSYVESRWLSLCDCLRRIIDLWEPLKKILWKQQKTIEGIF